MPLHVTHYEKGYVYTASQLLMLAKKVGRLSRYCRTIMDESSMINIETVSQDTKKHRDSVMVMITIRLPHQMLRAESRKGAALYGIDRCVEKLESQIERYKQKHVKSLHAVRSRK